MSKRHSNSSASVHSGSTFRAREDGTTPIRDPSPPFEYPSHGDPDPIADEPELLSTQDYTAQRDLILQDDAGTEDEDDEEFVYPGVDADASQDYGAALAAALGDDPQDVEDRQDEHEVEAQLQTMRTFRFADKVKDQDETLSDRTPSTPPRTPPRSEYPRQSRPPLTPASSRRSESRPFLHPSVSRLRSVTQQRMPSSQSVSTFRSVPRDGVSPSPSNFSAISRASSSFSKPRSVASESVTSERSAKQAPKPKTRDAFRWTSLKIITDYMFPTASQKASAVLGSSWGNPTAIAANGLICIGTDLGFTVVFDFRQQFKFICGAETAAKSLGPVTALALSYDHTFVAVGYASGHINLFELAHPQAPARSVPPTTLSAVASGRKEGHLLSSPVTSLGFVGLRHTAVVSADDSGLAFYHSLGKVLFVEANDVLRILGKYPEAPAAPEIDSPSRKRAPSTSSDNTITPGSQGQASGYFVSPPAPRLQTAILAMAPLPLGTSPHPTDTYQLVALLTPIKLVVVGLKPTPRTWFRRHRQAVVTETPPEPQSASNWQGCLSWYPSVLATSTVDGSEKEKDDAPSVKKPPSNVNRSHDLPKPPSVPMLAYSWAGAVKVLEAREEVVDQVVQDAKVGGGKKKVVKVGQIVLKEIASWDTSKEVLALQWLNVQQLLVLTVDFLEVYDIRSGSLVDRAALSAKSLVSYPAGPSWQDAPDMRVSHSMRVYKGKVFLLTRQGVRVGTLLSWADRILSFVQEGDFLSAIDLTRSYYTGTEQGNQTGLPEDPSARQEVVGKKLRDLMLASASYAFSEDRMTDETHYALNGRGVDRTSLFEGLVTSCLRASLSLNDYDFLYEDLFERYQSSGIESIFLSQIEPFIVDGSLRVVPTYVTQKLIAMHGEKGEYDKAERVIWHIDPSMLDSHQAITLCQQYQLYDALIYVYTRTLQDFVSPVLELMGLVRKVQQRRKERMCNVDLESDSQSADSSSDTDALIEELAPNAYKIFSYLGNVLSGLTYPSEEPLPPELESLAKKAVYQFLFSGHSIFWPPGPGGTLVLTADEEGGAEPTYPYLRLLLQFDAEALLHAIDMAFEDSYLNDTSQGVSRQVIVNILLKIVTDDAPSPRSLLPDDITFIRIFIARNIPKYPQFIAITPSAQQGLLYGLAADADLSTREDRQLAAEFLLSTYTPHNRDELTGLFEDAGFYRILRSWYRQDRAWAALLATYLRDPDLRPDELFSSVDSILRMALRSGKGLFSPDVKATAVDSLPQLLVGGITATAYLVDKYLPESHVVALDLIGAEESYKQFLYLRSLIEPTLLEEEVEVAAVPTKRIISNKLDRTPRSLYVSLMCLYDPTGIIRMIETLPEGYLDSADVIRETETAGVFEVVVWLMDREGSTRDAFAQLESASKRMAGQLAAALLSEDDGRGRATAGRLLERQTTLIRMGIRLCRAASQDRPAEAEANAEELWFQLLRTQVEVVQQLSSAINHSTASTDYETVSLDTLRGLIQETFATLVSQSSSSELSFPRLFKRLVDATTASRSASKGYYTEFRLILTGMLESYRFEGEFLTLNNRLVAQDLFDTVADGVKARTQGWRPTNFSCAACREAFREQTALDPKSVTSKSPSDQDKIAILKSGLVYHSRCLPANVLPSG